jgi:alkanesulfonate monooxygenase SsuD/methylene tetrahydromethanopterin reductase-like flavin-dependent oxidoreductase (luciferase family)
VTAGVPVALGPDEESARRLAAWWLATYCKNMGPIYPRMLAERFGHAAAVDAVLQAEPGGDLPAVAEELARDVTLMGTYDEAPRLTAAWTDAGADAIALVLPPGRPQDELSAVVDAAAA